MHMGHPEQLRMEQPNRAYEILKECKLCPRNCGVARIPKAGTPRAGYCRQTDQLKVAYVGPHMGEEPPITGKRGSGTVFLTGCSLRCSFCQNYQISHEGIGEPMDPKELANRISHMIHRFRVHNVNFVTPDHFFPHVFQTISLVRQKGLTLPVVMNLSGYQSIEMLKLAGEFTDIYLPDFKYAHSSLAKRLSACPDYPSTALAAIEEMLRQKGYLTTERKEGIGTTGVLVRHLILPGYVENSCEALTMLFVEFGKRLPLSIMSQYYPVRPQKDSSLNRTVTREEFDRILNHARDLGFEKLYVQFPENLRQDLETKPSFVPDFSSARPFE